MVTLFTPDGAYGGPVRVALNQARALRSSGHDVTVIGGARGFGSSLPTVIDDVEVRLFPAITVIPRIGFAGLASPTMLRWVRRNVRSFDVVHVHAARDFITLPAAQLARSARVRYVIQSHGMIDRSTSPLAIPLDAILTRPVLRGAHRVFFLTPREEKDLSAMAGPRIRLEHLPNGVPSPPVTTRVDGADEVLYLARLATRKRPALFVRMAAELTRSHPTTRFCLVGPDEGEGDVVRRLISDSGQHSRIVWEGSLPPDQTASRMSRAGIYVLPSIDEPYPMSVLEAMSLGLPVVITESCGLAPMVREAGCGIVIDDTLRDLITAVDQLLSDTTLAQRLGRAGAVAARDRFAMDAIAAQLERAYRR